MSVDPARAPTGSDTPMKISGIHAVNGRSMVPPFDEHLEEIVLGMGCFWGAERLFWRLPGVHVTAVGYAGGSTPNPTYAQTCTGLTGHAEVVRVIFDPARIDLESLFKVFWEAHDPTQGDRQGNDMGPQYRSIILTTNEAQRQAAQRSRDLYQRALDRAGGGSITTEIAPLDTFYYAEEEHQQYLHKVPGGYCALRGTGVSCPIG